MLVAGLRRFRVSDKDGPGPTPICRLLDPVAGDRTRAGVSGGIPKQLYGRRVLRLSGQIGGLARRSLGSRRRRVRRWPHGDGIVRSHLVLVGRTLLQPSVPEGGLCRSGECQTAEVVTVPQQDLVACERTAAGVRRRFPIQLDGPSAFRLGGQTGGRPGRSRGRRGRLVRRHPRAAGIDRRHAVVAGRTRLKSRVRVGGLRRFRVVVKVGPGRSPVLRHFDPVARDRTGAGVCGGIPRKLDGRRVSRLGEQIGGRAGDCLTDHHRLIGTHGIAGHHGCSTAQPGRGDSRSSGGK